MFPPGAICFGQASRPRPLTVNAVLQPFGDEPMAYAASGRHVGGIKAVPRIVRKIDCVRTVATGASGRDQEPRLIQAVAVGTLDEAGFMLLVALAASLDLVVDKHRRTLVGHRQDPMRVRAVALAASEHSAATLLVLLARMLVDARA